MKQSESADSDQAVTRAPEPSTQKLANKPLLWGKHCRGPGCDDFNEQRPSCICECAACKAPWSIEVQQGDLPVGAVELLHDSDECKVFVIRPKQKGAFGVAHFYAHGACYAAVLGFGLRHKETQVALRTDTGGWHSFCHSAADGIVWTVMRYHRSVRVWESGSTHPEESERAP